MESSLAILLHVSFQNSCLVNLLTNIVINYAYPFICEASPANSLVSIKEHT